MSTPDPDLSQTAVPLVGTPAGTSSAPPERLYIGSYTASSGGHGTGVTVLERAGVGAKWQAAQVVEADDPSFLVLTEGALHAVSETTEGRVLSYTLSGGLLSAASSAATGGSAPCHIMVDPASGALVVSNYVGGTVGVLRSDAIDPSRITRTVALPHGRGPVLDRQERPHAHQVSATPTGSLIASDLGSDRLVEFVVDPVSLDPTVVATHPLPSGSGPRHVAWLGDRLIVVGELDARLHVLRRDDEGRLVLDHSVEVFEGSASTQGVFPSHLAVDNGRVYVATRGRDTISVLTPDDADGRLRVVGEASCGGTWPRHFAITPGVLYCANQGSDTVAVLPLDPETGVPGEPLDVFALGSPACIVAA
ncbi:lactonase family protein [Frigoribacterium sp. 2-23]|uniref:lactonase family protein n=1 Tax=Frigoribacterium sp. 2-23 TaxID=3415006 RepID=UPI003C6FF6DC